jgi:hypothetical protein
VIPHVLQALVYYCSPSHQSLHWKSHKQTCNISSVSIIVLNGTIPSLEKTNTTGFTRNNGWERCPVPHLLGIPLYAKAGIRDYPNREGPFQQFAVFMMVDPVFGMAPPSWKLGPHCYKGINSRDLMGWILRSRSGVIYIVTYNIFYMMDMYSEGDERRELE